MNDGTIDVATGPSHLAGAGRACARWVDRARGRAMPGVPDLPATGTTTIVRLDEVESEAEDLRSVDGLRDLLHRRATTITAPVWFRAEPGMGTGWSGLLLPYADAHGRVAAVQVMAERFHLPSRAEHRRLRTEWKAAGPATPRRTGPPTNPWRPEADAAQQSSALAAERSAAARTWLALAQASPVCAAEALPRAAAAGQAAGQDGDALVSRWMRDLPKTLRDRLPACPPEIKGIEDGPGQPPFPSGSTDRPDALELRPVDLGRIARRLPTPPSPVRVAA